MARDGGTTGAQAWASFRSFEPGKLASVVVHSGLPSEKKRGGRIRIIIVISHISIHNMCMHVNDNFPPPATLTSRASQRSISHDGLRIVRRR